MDSRPAEVQSAEEHPAFMLVLALRGVFALVALYMAANADDVFEVLPALFVVAVIGFLVVGGFKVWIYTEISARLEAQRRADEFAVRARNAALRRRAAAAEEA